MTDDALTITGKDPISEQLRRQQAMQDEITCAERSHARRMQAEMHRLDDVEIYGITEDDEDD